MAKVSDNILVRVYWLLAMFIIFGMLIIFQVVRLQLHSDEWRQEEMDFITVEADRGNILSEDGIILATNLPRYKIGLDPTIIDTTAVENFSDSLMKLCVLIADNFGGENRDSLLHEEYYQKIMEARANDRQYMRLIRKELNYEELQEVSKWPILSLGRYHGGFVIEKTENKRFYPFKNMARITLGILKDDTVGIRGVEYSYNKELRGRHGYVLVQKIAGNSYIPLDQYGDGNTEDGQDVVTTLDVDLQDIVESALKDAVEEHEAKSGTAILMEVGTGKIKAIANYPEVYNYAFAMQVEPGSTLKLASAVAALEDKIIGMDDTVDTGDGTVTFDDKTIKDDFPYGKIPFRKVIAKSSNVGVSTVISENYMEQPDRFLAHLDRFGLTEIANTQIKGEPSPKVIRPDTKQWNIATLPSMSIGYSISLTPLQIATFYNAIANGGKLMQPYLVKELRDGARVVKRYEPIAKNEQIASDTTIQQVHQLLREVVEYGTAKNINDLSFPIAGKTGTARKSVGGEYRQIHQASFAGFFPADNPRYTCYVLIDEPSAGQIYGAQVAAPVFKEIAEQVYATDRKLAQYIEQDSSLESVIPMPTKIAARNVDVLYNAFGLSVEPIADSIQWVEVQTDSVSKELLFKAAEHENDRIPDVRGMSARDALVMLESLGVSVSMKGNGRVKRQSLLPGYRIGKRTQITLFLG